MRLFLLALKCLIIVSHITNLRFLYSISLIFFILNRKYNPHEIKHIQLDQSFRWMRRVNKIKFTTPRYSVFTLKQFNDEIDVCFKKCNCSDLEYNLELIKNKT